MFNKNKSEKENVENIEEDLMDKLDLYKTVLIRGFVTEYNENLSHVTIHFGKSGYNPYMKRIEFEKDELKNILEDVGDFEKENTFEEIVRNVEESRFYDYEGMIKQFEVFFREEYCSSLNESYHIWGRKETNDMIKNKNHFLLKFIIRNMRKDIK